MRDSAIGERILIIGSGGSGKSTLARALGERTGLPVIHLDSEYWQPGWVGMDKEEWAAKVEKLAADERWIMDGNFGNTREIRMRRADTVIFLDMNRLLCLYWGLKRQITYHGRTRPDMGADCPEKIDFEYYKWVWTYPSHSRQVILDQLSMFIGRVVILKNRRAVAAFLEEVNNDYDT